MGEIQKLRARARRSRAARAATPVVSTVAEAQALALAIADQLAQASPEEALLCLASLQEIQAALEARLALLRDEMAETRRQLDSGRQGARACVSYGAAAGLGGRNSAH